MNIDFRYRDFDPEIAIFLYRSDAIFTNFYWEEYVVNITQDEFWWFMASASQK